MATCLFDRTGTGKRPSKKAARVASVVRKCTDPTEWRRNTDALAPASLLGAVQRITSAVRDGDGVAVLLPFLGVSSLDFKPLLVGGFFLSGAMAVAESGPPIKHDCAEK
ncbi:hypothetical protein [Methylobacterium sp. NFXW15]|uniref:hypothetical protein n=1 Tax=Methylobacterium sp. NFXW15 TaxID=2819512 RepID=UPI003CF89AA0